MAMITTRTKPNAAVTLDALPYLPEHRDPDQLAAWKAAVAALPAIEQPRPPETTPGKSPSDAAMRLYRNAVEVWQQQRMNAQAAAQLTDPTAIRLKRLLVQNLERQIEHRQTALHTQLATAKARLALSDAAND